MKKLMMLMLASSFVTITSARADVGKDKSAPNCQQIIQSVQEQIKKSRPVASDSSTAPTAPASGSAQ